MGPLSETFLNLISLRHRSKDHIEMKVSSQIKVLARKNERDT